MRSLRQKDCHEFKACLGYIAKFDLKNENTEAGEVSLASAVLAHSMRTESGSQYHVKGQTKQSPSIILAFRGQNISGAHWPVILAEWMSFRFSERLRPQKLR